jgi:hypothetical protein
MSKVSIDRSVSLYGVLCRLFSMRESFSKIWGNLGDVRYVQVLSKNVGKYRKFGLGVKSVVDQLTTNNYKSITI